MKNILSFNKIPQTWEHYLPLGNGRMGGMLKTHPGLEILQLNEEGIWSGGPQDRFNPDSKKYLKKIRSLLKTGDVPKAQELAVQCLSGTSYNQRVYQTAGEFKIDFFQDSEQGMLHGWPVAHKCDDECIKTYSSTLNLENATVTVKYTDSKGINYTRTTWISAAHDMIFMYVTADQKEAVNFSATLDRGIWVDSIYRKNDCIFLSDSHGIPFTAGAGVVAQASRKGEEETKGVTLTGTKCDSALFFVDIKAWQHPGKNITKKEYDKLILKDTWSLECEKHLLQMKKYIQKLGPDKAFETLLVEHTQEYEKYWKDFDLCIGSSEVNSKAISTPDLLGAACDDNLALVNQYAAFSRYLLISSSRKPGILPANLQGIWNCYMDPPWGSKYTININAQMNYWPVNICGLSTCHEPLFNLLERAYENGLVAAKQMYSCRGYVLHHNTDFWGDAAPQDSWIAGTYWVLGAAWLATHIWEQYEYTKDLDFLKKYYYLIHEACLFFVDNLQETSEKADDNKPYLILNPSVSPENTYVSKTGQNGTMCAGCQMDNMVLEHLFTCVLKAKSVLRDKAVSKKQKEYDSKDFEDFVHVRNHLKKPDLNPDGSLMEWNEVVQEVEKGHRHISHLYGLFPGISIDGFKDKELAQACKKTLVNRLQNGGGHTGWSQAWIINFYASLGMGDSALSSIVKLLAESTLPNLLDNHPPFQIDGNFGALAGIVRLLVQSRINTEGKTEVRLLPSLPTQTAWQTGKIRGVCVKGSYKLNFEWENGVVKNLQVFKKDELLETPQLIADSDFGYVFEI